LVGPELELESERGEKNKNIIIIKNIREKKLKGGKMKRWGMKKDEERRVHHWREKTVVCVSQSHSVWCIYDSASPPLVR
jgi:hypothetical protein